MNKRTKKTIILVIMLFMFIINLKLALADQVWDFDGQTTDLDSKTINELEKIKLKLQKSGFGMIDWQENLNLTEISKQQLKDIKDGLKNNVNIESKKISVDGSDMPHLKKSAIIIFETPNTLIMPYLKRDGLVCDDCVYLGYNGGYRWLVPHFSTYTLNGVTDFVNNGIFNNTHVVGDNVESVPDLVFFASFDENASVIYDNSVDDDTMNTTAPDFTNDCFFGNTCLENKADRYLKPSNNKDFLGTDILSFCGWFKINSYGGGNNGNVYNNGQQLLWFTTTNDRVQLTHNGGAGSKYAYSADSSLNISVWNHVCMARNTAGLTNITVNGTLSGAANQDAGTPTAATTDLYIFNRNVQDRWLDGTGECLQWWNTTLTPQQMGNVSVSATCNETLYNPIITWKLNQYEKYGDDSSVYNDYTTNNYHGYWVEDSSKPNQINYGECYRDSCLSFDGIDDHIEIFPANETMLDFNFSQPRSYFYRLRNNDTPGTYALFGKSDGAGLYTGFLVYLSVGQPYFRIYDNGISSGIRSRANVVITDDKWHSVLITYDGANTSEAINFYVDGVNTSTTPSSLGGFTKTSTLNNATFTIMEASYGGLNTKGIITDVMIFDDVLDANNASYLHNRTGIITLDDFAAQNIIAPVGYFPLEPYQPDMGVFYNESGNISGAIEFDGIDDTYTLTGNSIFDINSTTDMTFTFSLKPDKINESTNQAIFVKSATSLTNLRGYYISITNDFVKFVANNGTSGAQTISSNPFLNNNSWYHVGIVVNRTGGYNQDTVDIYINGIFQKGEIINKRGNWDRDITGKVGTLGSNLWFYSGLLDEFKIHNRSLNATEILQEYNARPVRLYKNHTVFTEYIDTTNKSTVTNITLQGIFYNQTEQNFDCSIPNLLFCTEFDSVIQDESAVGNILTNHGVTLNHIGIINNSVYFDGVDDYIDFEKPMNGSQWVELWFKTKDGSTNNRLITNGANGDVGWTLQLNLGNIFITNGSTASDLASQTVAAFNDNKWHHVFAKIQPPQEIWVDSINQSISTAASTISVNGNASIGARNAGTFHYKGFIDNIRVWNVSQAQEDIINLYYEQLANKVDVYVSMSEDNVTWDAPTQCNLIESDFGDRQVTYGCSVAQQNYTKVDYHCDSLGKTTCKYNYSQTFYLQLPIVDEVNLTTANGQNLTEQDLLCSASFSTPEGIDISEVYYNWYVNGTISQTTLNYSTLFRQNTTITDTWVCEVIASDLLTNSTAINSTGLLILDFPVVPIAPGDGGSGNLKCPTGYNEVNGVCIEITEKEKDVIIQDTITDVKEQTKDIIDNIKEGISDFYQNSKDKITNAIQPLKQNLLLKVIEIFPELEFLNELSPIMFMIITIIFLITIILFIIKLFKFLIK